MQIFVDGRGNDANVRTPSWIDEASIGVATMPVFYFDVYDGFSGPDRIGMICADRDAAAREATRRVQQLLAVQADWFGTGQRWQIGIVDTTGASSFVLDFQSATAAVDDARVCNVTVSTEAAEPSPVSTLQQARRRAAFS